MYHAAHVSRRGRITASKPFCSCASDHWSSRSVLSPSPRNVVIVAIGDWVLARPSQLRLVGTSRTCQHGCHISMLHCSARTSSPRISRLHVLHSRATVWNSNCTELRGEPRPRFESAHPSKHSVRIGSRLRHRLSSLAYPKRLPIDSVKSTGPSSATSPGPTIAYHRHLINRRIPSTDRYRKGLETQELWIPAAKGLRRSPWIPGPSPARATTAVVPARTDDD